MSQKMSRRAQLLAQLAKDENLKDAFELIASSLKINNSEFSSVSLTDCYSDASDEDISDDDILDEDVSDDEEPPELCSDCKCGKKAVNGKSGTKTINKCHQKRIDKSDSILKTLQHFQDFYDSEDNDDASDCGDCQSSAMADQKTEELTEEEKRKRRNEKKRLQKKKKRDKRKAEKQSFVAKDEPNGGTKSEANKTIDNKINNNKNNNKKLEINNKTESNSNNHTKNKHKNETKAAAKQKENNDKIDPKSKTKEVEKPHSNSDASSLGNGRNSRESQSLKSSPKSDRESDNVQSDVEEEELLLSSAYVAQIAQRKNKPTVYQKTAQSQQNEAQEYAEEYGVAKHKPFSDNNSNISNNCDFVFKNNPNNNQNKFVLSNNSREVDDDSPKFKQYFFEKQKPTKTAAIPLTKEEKTLNTERSVEMAILANHRAENNQFVDAIDLFSQAIAFNPKDYRFYVNRSYCYDSIKDFRNALKDAEIAIKLKSDWPKCHYRKGKALAGLKNYAEAEIALKKVLTLESDCVEAIQDLRQVRYSAIVESGYDKSTAELYSSNYESIKDALSALSLRQEKQKALIAVNGNKPVTAVKKGNNWWNSANNYKSSESGARTGQTWDDDDIYISDDEFNSVREPTFEETSPTNPFGWKALWVGNVSLNAKLDTVTNMFRKYGNLNYCNIFKGNNGGNFILVHYDNADAPTVAMSKYQGKVIPGVSIADTPLTIRFRPNKDQKKPNYDQRLESDECYYWRTTGCARGDNCLYKHIQPNKGVDKQAWMCNPLRKNAFQKPQK